MARLYKKIIFLMAGYFVLCAVSNARSAQDYCSLQVRVVMPNGGRPPVPVVVKERDGRTTSREQDADGGDVLFCDLGIEPVTVIVGKAGCNQTTVRDVPLRWQKPYTLVVSYNFESCMNDRLPPPIPFCEIVLRIIDSTDQRVPGAKVQFNDQAHKDREADSAGRVLVLVKARSRLHGTVSALNYAPKDFVLECAEPVPHDFKLTLDPK